MRACWIILASFGITLGSIRSTVAETGLTVRTGLGYEYMSQEFFLDTQELSGSDSLELSTQLKTTYLDDFKGQVTLSYAPYDDYRLELRGVAEQTSDQLRLRLSTDYRPTLGSVKLNWSAEVERRNDRSTGSDVDYGYVSGYGRAKITVPVWKAVSLWAALRSDFVYFDSIQPDLYDYYRAGGQLGMVHTFSDFSSLNVNLFVTGREVARSVDQDYLNSGLEGLFFGFYAQGQVDALMRYEIRDYEQEAELGDYRRAEFTIANKHSLRERFFAREELEIETLRYDTADVLPQDYKRVELTLLAGLSQDSWSIAAGPEIEALQEQASSDYAVGEEYTEIGLKAQFDIILPGKVFASLESVSGRRDLTREGESDVALSDFNYERLNLLADVTILSGLSLNFLAAADWEWHDQPDENSRLYLISTSLTYGL